MSEGNKDKAAKSYVWYVRKPRIIGTLVIEPSRATTPVGAQVTVPSRSCRLVLQPSYVEIDPKTGSKELGEEIIDCDNLRPVEVEDLKRIFGEKGWKDGLARYIESVRDLLGIENGRPKRIVPLRVPEEFADEVRAYLASKGVGDDSAAVSHAPQVNFHGDFSAGSQS